MDASEVSIVNDQLVGTTGYPEPHISVMIPKAEMTADEALVHAAWLVILADPMGDRFQAILDRIRST